MANKNIKGIISLVLVVALSFGVICGSRALTKEEPVQNGPAANASVQTEDIDVSGYTSETVEIRGAKKTVGENPSYIVTVAAKGYKGDIVLDVTFANDGKTLESVAVVEHSETPDLGANIEKEEFLSQFASMEAPVYLAGETPKADNAAEETAPAAMADGEYEAKGQPDDNGMTDVVKMTITGGKITAVSWDAVSEDGKSKSVMSENGEYVMTEDGLTWKEQAEALSAALVENQSIDFFAVGDDGKTDAVSGVSIYVGGFTALAEDCMKQAAAAANTVALTDGEYEAKGQPDDNGMTDVVKMTIAGGKITAVSWDAVSEDGKSKSVMSENGEYVMTEDGLTWKEQAEALSAALVENQSIDFFAVGDDGKTDAVSGVSIYIGGFTALAEECLAQAAGTETETEAAETEAAEGNADDNSQMDGVSGATVSSKAVRTAINGAYEFVTSFILK